MLPPVKAEQGMRSSLMVMKEFEASVMAKATVGMITSYKGISPHQINWLWHQTPHHFGQWGTMQLQANAPQPDFLLMYQFTEFVPKPKRPKGKLAWLKQWTQPASPASFDLSEKLRGVPKERIIFLLREPPLEEVVEKHKTLYRQAEAHCGYISGPDDFAPQPDYMPAIWYVTNSFRELNEMPPPEKVRPCSWITSGIDRTESHRQRLAFLKLLRDNQVPFDLFGRNLPTWSQPSGELGNKWHAMAPYRYNLAIENYADNRWYVSEKLWDALLAWCLPIYYGGSAADALLPPGSFIRLPSLDEKGMEFIREITATPDAWYEAKDAIAEARQIVLHKLNLMNWLSEFVDQHS